MQKLNEIKQILKSGNYNINDVIEKYFKCADNINESENNIAYLNETCKTCEFCNTKELHYSRCL